MYSWVRSLLFLLPPHAAHAVGLYGLQVAEHLEWGSPPSFAKSLETERMGLTFAHPMGLGGGFDKNAVAPHALAALGFSFLELGTVTALAQRENPRPNMFRLPLDRALINRLGFPNDGAKRVVDRFVHMTESRAVGVPVAFSIGKSRTVDASRQKDVIDDYIFSLREVARAADFVVVNVSSPNTQNLRTLQAPEMARTLLTEIQDAAGKRSRRLPLLLKVAPDLELAAFDELLDVAKDVKLDGIVATNTTIAREGLQTPAESVMAMGAGGLSGPPLRERAVRMVSRARERLGSLATIVGVGGIEDTEHVRAYLAAGANLVQLYTGFVYGGPGVVRRIASELDERAQR